jgi:hypothetical protein
MTPIRLRARAAALGGVVLLLWGSSAWAAQEPEPTLEALLEGDIPARQLPDRLDACFESAWALEETREQEEATRRRQARERQAARDEERTREILEQLLQDPQRTVDAGALQEIEGMFPRSEEIRLQICEAHHERALRRLEILDELERCYRAAFDELGVGHLAPPEVDAAARSRAAAIRGFACSRELRPLATEVALPPGGTVVLVAATVCLDADLPRPGDGEAYDLTPELVPPKVLDLLAAAALDPLSLADVQEAIWRPASDASGTGPVGGGAISTGGLSSSRGTTLAEAVGAGTVDLTATVLDGFSSSDLVLSNRTGDPVTVTLTGARLQPRRGGGEAQSLGVAGQDQGQPPRAPSLETREERLARALRHARERLENAIERVRNGDHSPEALRELLKALREAEALGLDGDDAGEALQSEGFDTLVDGWWERADESYDVWKHDPTDANREQALRDFRAVERVGGPPDRASDDYDHKLADLAGE